MARRHWTDRSAKSDMSIRKSKPPTRAPHRCCSERSGVANPLRPPLQRAASSTNRRFRGNTASSEVRIRKCRRSPHTRWPPRLREPGVERRRSGPVEFHAVRSLSQHGLDRPNPALPGLPGGPPAGLLFGMSFPWPSHPTIAPPSERTRQIRPRAHIPHGLDLVDLPVPHLEDVCREVVEGLVIERALLVTRHVEDAIRRADHELLGFADFSCVIELQSQGLCAAARLHASPH